MTTTTISYFWYDLPALSSFVNETLHSLLLSEEILQESLTTWLLAEVWVLPTLCVRDELVAKRIRVNVFFAEPEMIRWFVVIFVFKATEAVRYNVLTPGK